MRWPKLVFITQAMVIMYVYSFLQENTLKCYIYLKVKCFHCGGGLEKWQPGDSVVGEHRKWFGNCEFIR